MESNFSNLLKPRWFPLLAAVASLLLLFAAGEKYLNHLLLESFSIQQHYVDDASYVSHVSAHYKEENKKTIILLGGSVTREISLSNIEMENSWFNKFGDEIDFINIGSSDQTLFESLAILSTFNIPPNAIIILQFSYKKLDSDLNHLKQEYLYPRTTYLNYKLLGDMLPISDKLERIIKPKILLYAGPIKNYLNKRGCGVRFLLTSDGRTKCYKEKNVNRERYANKKALSLSEKKEYVWAMQRQVIPDYLKHHEIGLKIIEKISTLVKKNDAHLMLAIYPFDEAEAEIYGYITNTPLYESILDKIEKWGGVLNYAKNTTFNHNDFYDTQHLTQSGKIKFSNILLNNLNEIISGKVHDERRN